MVQLLDILLQRNDAGVPWGFRVRGGLDFGTNPIISSVASGTLASQYLHTGDKILEVNQRKAASMLESEVNEKIDDDKLSLHLLVEKASKTESNGVSFLSPPLRLSAPGNSSYDILSQQECVQERERHPNGVKHSTKIFLRESNQNPLLGTYDLQVNFERTKYKPNDDFESQSSVDGFRKNKSLERMQVMSENFDKIFRQKIGEWLEVNMLNGDDHPAGKQQTNAPVGGGLTGGPPPPPPSFPGPIAGRRLKTEIPERCIEPPAAIQNAMMTKDKKPFTYTPGGIDLSEIRSPRMARRINRNAHAEEMTGLPAPTTNQHPPIENTGNTNFAAMQSQLPAQVLPPPPPPPPPSGGAAGPRPPPPPVQPVASNTLPRPMAGRPPLGFDPNELLARVNKTPAYEPAVQVNNREEPSKNFRSPPAEEKPFYEPKQTSKANENSTYSSPVNEPGHIYVPNVPNVAAKIQNEPVTTYNPTTNNQPSRGQLGSIYIPPVTTQEQKITSPSTVFGQKAQQSSPTVVSPACNVEPKPQAPWANAYRTPQTNAQSSVPWANRETESPKSGSTRVIPIQIEGRGSPKPTTPSPQPMTTPPPFLQKQQMRQQSQPAWQQQQHQQSPQPTSWQQQQSQQPTWQQQQPQTPTWQQPSTQQVSMRQSPMSQSQQQSMYQPPAQHPSNTRVIPIQIEGSSPQQNKSPSSGFNQNKFNPMTPQSPTPYSPCQENDQKPQWAPVQPRPFKKEPQMSNEPGRMQQTQPEYGTYNTAGVPISQLRKMQLSDDDRALMDKFKNQVEIHGNDILNDENTNPRYRGGYIPSRVFKMLDESVDEEVYLHSETDPRYRGAAIPSRAFRMLQSMTETTGNFSQQVPKSPSRDPAGTPMSGVQYKPEAPQGSYVPPSEQQVQEPRKYTGGSIPSRSFRMLQAMTGQEASAPKASGPPSGRETPVSGANRWCPSPSPPPLDPYWGYYPPDPYFIYNYISDLNAAYGLPPPPPPLYHPPIFHSSYHYPMYHSYGSDNDEQGYSSTDELGQYYANYRRNFGYSPFQPNTDRCYSLTPTRSPTPFKIPRVCVTPVRNHERSKREIKLKLDEKLEKEEINSKQKWQEDEIQKVKENEEEDEEEEDTVEDEESETETEVDEETGTPQGSLNKLSSLQSLKSVHNVGIYTSESSSTVVQDDYQEEIEEEEEEEEISTSESFEESEPKEVPHQLSIIFEESEASDADNLNRKVKNQSMTISESESCSTISNGVDDDMLEHEALDSESSVTVRLPLKLKFNITEKEEDITVIVGDSIVQKDNFSGENSGDLYDSMQITQNEEWDDTDDADVSVTFTLPSRSNSIKSVERSFTEKNSTPEPESLSKVEEISDQEVEAEVTVCLPFIAATKAQEIVKEENCSSKTKTENSDSPVLEEDSSSTSVQSVDTILHPKEDTDEECDEKEAKGINNKDKIKDWKETEETEEEKQSDINYKAGVGKLEEMISALLESTNDTMSSSMELSLTDLEDKFEPGGEAKKKDSQEESEDDSGVNSDMSIKQVNSETDVDTESDYCELSKMNKFQRASTHSRLFKLLQEECEKCEKEEDEEEAKNEKEKFDKEETLCSRKQKLTLPLHVPSELESLSSSSGFASPSSPTVSDRLVKELIHSLLNKRKGKKFRKLPFAKLHAAALKILQEEMDTYDISPTSGDDSIFLSPSQKNSIHSKLTANIENFPEADPECIYGDNYYDYLQYYNTWGYPDYYYPEDYDIVPSKTFRLLREQTSSPYPVEGFKAKCPRVASKKNIPENAQGRATPIVTSTQDSRDEIESLSFTEKKEKVGKVLERSMRN